MGVRGDGDVHGEMGLAAGVWIYRDLMHVAGSRVVDDEVVVPANCGEGSVS